MSGRCQEGCHALALTGGLGALCSLNKTLVHTPVICLPSPRHRRDISEHRKDPVLLELAF